MKTDVVTVEPETTLREAVELLSAEGISGAPVVRGSRVKGVFSVPDILRFQTDMPAVPTERPEQADWGEFEDPEVWKEGDTPASSFFFDFWSDVGADVWERVSETEGPEWDVLQEHTVSEIMTRVLCTLTPETEVHEAADYMIRAGVHRLLVTHDLALVGIVTATDILRAVAERKI
jgi:CBS domain-containing protein